MGEGFKSEKVWREVKEGGGVGERPKPKKRPTPKKGVSLRQRRDDRLARSRPGTVTRPRCRQAGRQAGKSH